MMVCRLARLSGPGRIARTDGTSYWSERCMRKSPSYLPDAGQTLLLKAALSEGGDAVGHWNAWRRTVDVDELDLASQRLLPLLFNKLLALGIDDPDLDRYRSVARYVWSDNQLRVRRAQQVLSLFAEAGIAAMPIKGLAIAPLYYGNFRLRAMNDVDILVPGSSIPAACQVLSRNGWHSQHVARLGSEAYRLTTHATEFRNADGAEIDLHWYLSSECCRPDAEAGFWHHAQPLTLGGLDTRTLSDTDHLFHTLTHGSRSNDVSPIRWVADSAHILRTGSIDWQRLLDHADEFSLILRMQRTLGVLHDVFSLPIPAPAMERLAAMRPASFELLEERVTRSPRPNALKSSLIRYVNYRRNVFRRSWDRGLLSYAQDVVGVRSLAAMSLWLARRLLRGRGGQ